MCTGRHIHTHTQLRSESFVYSRDFHFDVAKYENYNLCFRNVPCELVALLQRRQSCYTKKEMPIWKPATENGGRK